MNPTPAKRLSAAMPEDPADLGPAMQALNPRERAFVDALFVLGSGGTYVQAAEMAGYQGSRQTLITQGSRLAHKEKIQAAIREEAGRRQVGRLPVLTARLAAISDDSSHRQQFEAIKHEMALAGHSPKVQHEVVHKTDRASLLAEIAGNIELLKALGVSLDLDKLTKPTIIDVTPEPGE